MILSKLLSFLPVVNPVPTGYAAVFAGNDKRQRNQRGSGGRHEVRTRNPHKAGPKAGPGWVVKHAQREADGPHPQAQQSHSGASSATDRQGDYHPNTSAGSGHQTTSDTRHQQEYQPPVGPSHPDTTPTLPDASPNASPDGTVVSLLASLNLNRPQSHEGRNHLSTHHQQQDGRMHSINENDIHDYYQTDGYQARASNGTSHATSSCGISHVASSNGIHEAALPTFDSRLDEEDQEPARERRNSRNGFDYSYGSSSASSSDQHYQTGGHQHGRKREAEQAWRSITDNGETTESERNESTDVGGSHTGASVGDNEAGGEAANSWRNNPKIARVITPADEEMAERVIQPAYDERRVGQRPYQNNGTNPNDYLFRLAKRRSRADEIVKCSLERIEGIAPADLNNFWFLNNDEGISVEFERLSKEIVQLNHQMEGLDAAQSEWAHLNRRKFHLAAERADIGYLKNIIRRKNWPDSSHYEGPLFKGVTLSNGIFLWQTNSLDLTDCDGNLTISKRGSETHFQNFRSSLKFRELVFKFRSRQQQQAESDILRQRQQQVDTDIPVVDVEKHLQTPQQPITVTQQSLHTLEQPVVTAGAVSHVSGKPIDAAPEVPNTAASFLAHDASHVAQRTVNVVKTPAFHDVEILQMPILHLKQVRHDHGIASVAQGGVPGHEQAGGQTSSRGDEGIEQAEASGWSLSIRRARSDVEEPDSKEDSNSTRSVFSRSSGEHSTNKNSQNSSINLSWRSSVVDKSIQGHGNGGFSYHGNDGSVHDGSRNDYSNDGNVSSSQFNNKGSSVHHGSAYSTPKSSLRSLSSIPFGGPQQEKGDNKNDDDRSSSDNGRYSCQNSKQGNDTDCSLSTDRSLSDTSTPDSPVSERSVNSRAAQSCVDGHPAIAIASQAAAQSVANQQDAFQPGFPNHQMEGVSKPNDAHNAEQMKNDEPMKNNDHTKNSENYDMPEVDVDDTLDVEDTKRNGPVPAVHADDAGREDADMGLSSDEASNEEKTDITKKAWKPAKPLSIATNDGYDDIADLSSLGLDENGNAPTSMASLGADPHVTEIAKLIQQAVDSGTSIDPLQLAKLNETPVGHCMPVNDTVVGHGMPGHGVPGMWPAAWGYDTGSSVVLEQGKKRQDNYGDWWTYENAMMQPGIQSSNMQAVVDTSMMQPRVDPSMIQTGMTAMQPGNMTVFYAEQGMMTAPYYPAGMTPPYLVGFNMAGFNPANDISSSASMPRPDVSTTPSFDMMAGPASSGIVSPSPAMAPSPEGPVPVRRLELRFFV